MKSPYKAVEVKQQKQKKEILAELERTGIIEFACKKAGIGRSTFYNWKKKDPDFAKAVDEAMSSGVGVINDLAVSQLIQSIKNREMRAIQYWLDRRHEDFNAPYALAKLKLDLFKRQDHEEEIVLTPEEEAEVASALKALKSFQREAAGYTPSNANEEKTNDEDGNNRTDI